MITLWIRDVIARDNDDDNDDDDLDKSCMSINV